MTLTAEPARTEAGPPDPGGAAPPGGPGWGASSWETTSGQTATWLVAHRFELERGEARWLTRLAEFDEDGGWAAQGHLSCANWLMCHAQMGRSTAFEKLQVARALRRRPLVAEAFTAGRISYSVARIITRLAGASPEVDAALIELARTRTVAYLEQAARAYRLYKDQEDPPPEPKVQPSVTVSRVDDHHKQIVFTLDDLDAEEVLATVRLFMETSPSPQSARADRHGGPASPSASASADGAEPGESIPAGCPAAEDQSARADGTEGRRDYRRRQVDGFLTLLRTAAAHVGEPGATGADRYLVHVVVSDGTVTLADGSPLPPGQAARALCDASVVTHLYRDGEPVALGRRSRTWSTAQRRAALVRDGGHCRFPGCRRRLADLRHHRPWEEGGRTDLANAYTLCRRHHTLLHQRGFYATGAPNQALTFHAPGGQPIGTTTPVPRGVPGEVRAS